MKFPKSPLAVKRSCSLPDMSAISKSSEGCVVMIPDGEYDFHMTKVMAMKPSKRKKYKAQIGDKWGVKSRVVYRDGELWNYCLFERAYCVLKPNSYVQEKAWENSLINEAFPGYANIREAIADNHENEDFMALVRKEMEESCGTKIGAMSFLGYSDDEIQAASEKHREESYTGNHEGRRNFTIKCEPSVYVRRY